MAGSFGGSIKLTGESEYARSLRNINSSLKLTGAELKAATAKFKNNGEQVDDLKAKNALLEKSIAGEKSKIEILKRAVADFTDQQKRNAEQVEKLKLKYDEESKKLEEMKKSTKTSSEAIAAQEKAVASLSSQLNKENNQLDSNSNKINTYKIKIANAEKSVSDFSKELKDNKNKINGVDDALEKAEDQAKSFGSKIKSAAKDTSDAGDKFASVKSKASAFSSVLKANLASGAISSGVKALGSAVKSLGASFMNASKETMAYGDTIDKESQKIGLSAEAYQEWDFVMQQNGMSISSLKVGMKKLSTQAQANAKEFKQLGISEQELATLSKEDLFNKTIEGLSKMSAGTERTALANKLLGKSAVELEPLLNSGSKSIEALKNQAHDYGMIMSDQAVKASAKFNDSMNLLKQTTTGLKNNLVSSFFPAMTQVTDGLAKIFSGKYESGLKDVTKGVDDFISAFNKKLPKIIEAGVKILSSLATTLIKDLPKLINKLVPPLINGVVKLGDTIVKVIPSLIKSVVKAFNKIVPMLTNAIVKLGDAIIKILPDLINSMVKAIPTLVKACLSLIKTLLSTLGKNMSKIIDSLVEVIVEIAQMLVDPKNIAELLKGAIDLVIGVVTGLVTAIPKLLVGLGEAIVGGIKGLFQSATIDEEDVQGLQDSLDVVTEKFDELSEEAQQTITDTKNALNETFADTSMVDDLSDKLKQLVSDGTISEDEQGQVKTIVDILKDKVPDFEETWNTITTKDTEGNYALQKNAKETVASIDKVIQKYKEEAIQATATSQLEELITKQTELNKKAQDANAEFEIAQQNYNNFVQEQQDKGLTMSEIMDMDEFKQLNEALTTAGLSVQGFTIQQSELSAEQEHQEGILKALHGDYSNFDATLEAVNNKWITMKDVTAKTGLSYDELKKKSQGYVSELEKDTEKSLTAMKRTLGEYTTASTESGEKVALVYAGHKYTLSDLSKLSKKEFEAMSKHFNTKDWTKWGDDTYSVSKAVGEHAKETRVSVKNNVNKITTAFSKASEKSYKSGVDSAEGFIRGTNSQSDLLYNAGIRVGENFISGVKKGLDEHSPSKIMKKLGNFAVKGFTLGIDEKIKTVKAAAQEIANTTVSNANISGTPGTSKMIGSVNISFGDVSLASDQNIEEVAGQVSNIILKNVQRKAGAF